MQISLTDDPIIGPQLDIAEPVAGVEINLERNVLWVNVDGIMRLRICRIYVPITIEAKGKRITVTPRKPK